MEIGKILDISVPIKNGMPLYPGDPILSVERTADVSRGDPYTTTRISLGVHTGTHVDAPAHFIRGGRTIEQLQLNVLIGPARLVDLSAAEGEITGRVLQAADLPEGTDRILLKTRNSALWGNPVFRQDYVALTADGAQWLVDRGVRLVGIDYLSVEAFGSTDFAAHHILLDEGIIILEGVNLEHTAPGVYQLICLPLRMEGAEGAPARAVLIPE
jgi:arylformamidase